ncbi:hypothetical protein Tco_1460564 [Tanacetum coccineum]
MEWLTKYHGVIICDEKIIRVPFEREMLIFQGNGNNQREESRLNIVSCTKAQEYLSKGCDVFLAYITTKEAKDKSEGKRLEDVPIVRDFPEVSPEDLPAQEYLSKGCDVFLAHITTKEAKDKSEGKRLEDVLIVRNFPEVSPEDLPGIPPTRQVEFQIDLVPGPAPVARASYRLAPSEMKELVEQLQELSDKGFIRPISSP